MKIIHVLVEGPTEERFIKDILSPYFETKEIYLNPRNIKGVSKYSIIVNEIQNLLKDSRVDMVTTMLDFYGLPGDYPEKKSFDGTYTAIQKVLRLEQVLNDQISHPKFLPYLQLHEFEALLFCEVEHFKRIANTDAVKALQKMVDSVSSPEEINDSPHTAPSKRIESQIKSYNKPLHGIVIAKQIGLATMREKCSHFNQWLEKLEE
jgi:hypothetical protein